MLSSPHSASLLAYFPQSVSCASLLPKLISNNLSPSGESEIPLTLTLHRHISDLLAPLVDSWASLLPYARLISLSGDQAAKLQNADPAQAWLSMWQPLPGESEEALIREVVRYIDDNIKLIEGGVTANAKGQEGGERARLASLVRESEAVALKEGRRALADLIHLN
jgi:hypothetical protein